MSTTPSIADTPTGSPTTEVIIDFETTNLNLDPIYSPKGVIVRPALAVLDVGVIGVDAELNTTFTIDTLVEHVSPARALALIRSDETVERMHSRNGLVRDIEMMLTGEAHGMPLDCLDDEIVSHLSKDVSVVLGGSGVANFDRKIIERYLPGLASRLHFYPDDIGIHRRGYRRAVGVDLAPTTRNDEHRGFADAAAHLAEIRAFRDFYRRAKRLIEREDEELLSQ